MNRGRPARAKILESLLTQMRSRGMAGEHFDDLAADYMTLYDQKEALRLDIKERGTKIQAFNSSGKTTVKTNESLQDLLKVNKAMVDMLKNLGLNNSDQDGGGDEL